MPIRINLLAEQQALEEQRRKDPVKRAMYVAGTIVGILLAWAGYRQIQLMQVNSETAGLEARWKQLEKDYTLVTSNLTRIREVDQRIDALQTLATNRFLWAPMLNSLQFSVVGGIHLTKLKAEQEHKVTEGTKSVTNSAGFVVRGKPPVSRERTLFTVEGRDVSTTPGEQIFKLQELLRSNVFVRSWSPKVELTGRSAVQTDPAEPSRPFVAFTLELQFPEKVR